ncbi:MAG: pantoate--beta-alanine ligase [Rubellimicrobium sp.]|nr:pantoate--beta-alanine ligase [Rubellimicrobium sp.]
MQICRSVEDIRRTVAGWRGRDEVVGLVPTMGALHAGHLHLMQAARGLCDRVVATIFVNPTQFGDPRDLALYPRDEAGDARLLKGAGVDALFAPEAAAIYPPGDETVVETTHLAQVFHGAVRPGHFRGVATVVTKLLNIARPDHAFFGEKDYQQLAVIRRLARDLFLPVTIHGIPTVRDADGLALSSRNRRLDPADRAAAPVLNRALEAAAAAAARPGATVEDITRTLRDRIATEPRARLRACDAVWAGDFTPASGPLTQRLGLMVSAEFGPADAPVLLIDQREIDPQGG